MYNIVEGKCPNCGGIINYNMNEATALCKYCGTQFYVRDVIHNHNNYIVSNANTDMIATSFEAAMKLVSNGDYKSAARIFNKIRADFPADYRGYLGDCIVDTNNFSEDVAKNIAHSSASAYWDKYSVKKVSSRELEKTIEDLDRHKTDIIWPPSYLKNMQNAISLSKSNSVGNMFSEFAKRCMYYHRLFFQEKITEMNKHLEIIRTEENIRQYYIEEQKKQYRNYSVLAAVALILGVLAMIYVIINAGVIPEEGNEDLFTLMVLSMLGMFGVVFFAIIRRAKCKRNIVQ